MKNGIDYLVEVAGGRRSIAVLADMNELGAEWPELHHAVGAYAAKRGVDMVIAYGEKAKEIARGAAAQADGDGSRTQAHSFTDKAELVAYLESIREDSDVFFVKGSNSLNMDEVVVALQEGGRARGDGGTR
jgi:UDP-N-acetylmuramoyl-tripeptide--D-alanyl-D-alanine ligase